MSNSIGRLQASIVYSARMMETLATNQGDDIAETINRIQHHHNRIQSMLAEYLIECKTNAHILDKLS